MMLRHCNAYFASLTLVLGVGATASAQPKAKPLPEGAQITHYGIYKEGFKEATKLELEWFGKHLKAPAPKPEK